MKKISDRQRIINYISSHPNCKSTDITRDTGIARSAVVSALKKMADDTRVKRHGPLGKYTYTVSSWVEIIEEVPPEVEGPEFTPRYGCSNPLTHMFNQKLAEVRAVYGRMG
ncbi:MarR family transcriptional regulator [Klebsiella sp. 2680]|uniref:MarR family transcriptional regulator n=1 Tax=Klebsiella sp. 2680 TaxID=2018037 RepID=UPI00115C3060|nr:helix-turn-helix domain-containing protein [Klebsiella sp. 2680]